MHVVIWWLASTVVGGVSHFVGKGRRYGLLGDLSLGIVGGALSGCLSLRLGLTPASPAIAHAAVAAGGAVVAIGVTRLLLRRSQQGSLLTPARSHDSSLKTLEAQVSQLGEAECCVLSKLLEREPIARDYDADFDRQLGVADRLADRVAAFGGSWSFIGLSAALLLTWLFYNSETSASFDSVLAAQSPAELHLCPPGTRHHDESESPRRTRSFRCSQRLRGQPESRDGDHGPACEGG